MANEKTQEQSGYPIRSFYSDNDTNLGIQLLVDHYNAVGSLDGKKVTKSSTIRNLVKREVRELGLVRVE